VVETVTTIQRHMISVGGDTDMMTIKVSLFRYPYNIVVTRIPTAALNEKGLSDSYGLSEASKYAANS
jgi:hypothetical protein